jgi:hypothetical protein
MVVHGRSLGFGFTDLDDRDLIIDDHAFLVAPGSLWRVFGRSYMHVVDAGHAYYRPIVSASFVLDASWSGVHPFGYHLTNVALFAVTSALVHALLRALGFGRGIAAAGALIFAVHPALAAAVAWIPGRNETLVGIGVLASWLAFLRDRERPGWRRMALHQGFFALALFTKESAVVLPLVCATCAALLAAPRGEESQAPLANRRSRAYAYILGWAIVVGVRVWVYPQTTASARATLANWRLVVTSLGKILLPSHLSVFAVSEDLSLWPGMAALIVLVAALVRLPRIQSRTIALGFAAYLLFLAPALFLPGSLVLDHRLVLPAVGAFVVVAEIARAMALERHVFHAAAGATIVAASIVTLAFETAFRDPVHFARDAVEGAPHSALAHVCLGRAYQSAGDDRGALAEYRAALALGPAEVVHNNIAVIAMARGAWQEAERELAAELTLNPNYGRAYYNLGIVLRNEGRMADACMAEDRAAERAPDDAEVLREREKDCR